MSVVELELPDALEIPARGWLRGLFERGALDLAAQMDTAVAAIRRSRRLEYVAVFGGKGGAGKTTTSTGLGSTLAGVMRDRVAVVDSNPDKGTLRLKFPTGQSALPLHQLAGRTEQLRSYSDLRPYLLSNELGLDALTSSRHRDPAADGAVYAEILDFLAADYRVVVTDCGTSATSDAAREVLARATQLVVVTPAQIDGFYALLETLDELVDMRHRDLLGDAVAVINGIHESTSVDVDKIHADLKRRVRAVRRIPHDPHLAAGAAFDFAELQPATKVAYAELAATVTARFR
ncbi:MinD/ParA family protein [Rhodococcus jostii]|uniref:AAA family ATPase n=1 Tax=Rhodococcus jostii TaxID=132919 RepID=A0ABU4CN03_RHOJO|nr:AAA family ATPase [Rhodococcus jostii]MDV6284966.1 AAA family ATPase [Rhodococcus jostii]